MRKLDSAQGNVTAVWPASDDGTMGCTSEKDSLIVHAVVRPQSPLILSLN